MATINNINLGAAPNDGNGDTARAGGQKINDNLANLAKSAINTTATFTDPATDAAVLQATIDANSGVVITTTTAGNSQDPADPTDTTAGKKFTISNSSTSTDSFEALGALIPVGSSIPLLWDGGSWSGTPIEANASTVKEIFLSPTGSQTLTAATDTIASGEAYILLNATSDLVLTSTPSIVLSPKNGKFMALHNISAFTIDLQDESILAGSKINLGGSSGTIKAGGIMTLLHNDTNNDWTVLASPSLAAAGASADVIPVRNSSGSTIPAGSAVAVTGFNQGQARLTIGLADADNAAAVPSIGFTATAIANNANGDVVAAGSLIGLIDTSSASVNDTVYLSTIAGAVVFTRPTSGDIQQLGIVTRSNVNGNIIVVGAGRVNDLPLSGTMNTLTITGDLTAHRPIVSNANTSITLALTDIDTYIPTSAATAVTITIPTNAAVAFPIGIEIDIFQAGAGQVTFSIAGVTVISDESKLSLKGLGSGATLKKVATDTWHLSGLLA